MTMTATNTTARAPRNEDVACACHDVYGDQVETCESCGVEDCSVAVLDCEEARTEAYLCDGCTPRHTGCPSCDPDWYRDAELGR